MKYLLAYCAFLLAILFEGPVLAQGDIIRVEFPTQFNSNSCEMIPCAERGVLVTYEMKEFASPNTKSWYVAFFDTDLNELWNTSVPVVFGADLQDYILQGDRLYLFFLNTGKVKSAEENMQLTIVEFDTGVFYHIIGTVEDESSYCAADILGNTAVVGVTLKKGNAALYFIDFQSSAITEHTLGDSDESYVEEVMANDNTGRVDVILSYYISHRQDKLMLASFLSDGTLLQTITIDPVLDDKFLNTARIFHADDSTSMLIGTYSNGPTRISSTGEDISIEASGLFVTRIENKRQQYMNYYNLVELENLKSGITSREFYRMQRKKFKDNVEYSLNYEMVLHPLQEHSGEFILMADAYYPDYRTVSDITYDYWGRPITHTYTVFEGYQFFSGILTAFDRDGNLLWDNSIEISDLKTYQAKPVTSYFFDGDPTVLSYVKKDKIAYSVYLKEAELVSIELTDIKPLLAGDLVIEAANGRIIHWYDNHFLCTGEQVVRNNLLPEKEKRTVFFINKITFE